MILRVLFILIGPPVAYIVTGLIVRHYTRADYLAGNLPPWMGAVAIGICVTEAILTLCVWLWSLIRWLGAKKQATSRPLPISGPDGR